MVKRLVVGLLIGVVIGGLIGYGLFQILPAAMAGTLGYAFAALTGVIVGLVAGKPIWAREAGIEAGLKAFVGALLGAGILFGLRYLSLTIPAVADLPAAEIGQHPMSLAAIAVLLSVFYELDNTGGEEPPQGPKARVSAGGTGDKKRIAGGGPAVELEDDEPVAAKKKR